LFPEGQLERMINSEKSSQFFASLLLVLAGCSANNDVIGSCKTGALDDQSVICIDYHDAKNLDQWRTACNTVMQGEWSSGACNVSSSLGGCRAGNKVIWMYASERHSNSEDVESSCVAKSRDYLPPPMP
jgi:hypothetical protein